MLRADLVQYVDLAPAGLRCCRGWDIASTVAERAKDDPDYSVGTLCGWNNTGLYVLDVVRGQWTALERERRMIDAAKRDGRGVVVRIEAVGGYKDAFVRARELLFPFTGLGGAACSAPPQPELFRQSRKGAH